MNSSLSKILILIQNIYLFTCLNLLSLLSVRWAQIGEQSSHRPSGDRGVRMVASTSSSGASLGLSLERAWALLVRLDLFCWRTCERRLRCSTEDPLPKLLLKHLSQNTACIPLPIHLLTRTFSFQVFYWSSNII